MKTYSVSVIFDASKCVEVEADNAVHAIDLAYDAAGCANLCHRCSGLVDISGAVRAIVYDDSGLEVADDGCERMGLDRVRACLGELIVAMDGMIEVYGGSRDFDGGSKSGVELDLIQQARSAIAKAKGV